MGNPGKICNLCSLAYPDLDFWFHSRDGSVEICRQCSRAAVRLYSAGSREYALIHKDETERDPATNPFMLVADPQPVAGAIDLYYPKQERPARPPVLPVLPPRGRHG
jgi:hypothetical protein